MRMLFALLWTLASSRELSITDYGAVPGRANNATAAFENGKALYDAMRAAQGRRRRRAGRAAIRHGPYAPLYGLEHVELRLEGCLAAFEPAPGQHAKVWPFYLGNFESLITIHLSSYVGGGDRPGGGALNDGPCCCRSTVPRMSWVENFTARSESSRRSTPSSSLAMPVHQSTARHVAADRRLTDVLVRDITMLDSPRFNLYLGSYCRRVLVERVTILADWEAQAALQKSVPMFPFNTDGIDVAGKDITIRDIVVSNYDDVVAVKAADLLIRQNKGDAPGCTQNVTVYNTTVYRGAGLSVGSIHPSPLMPCVRDVLFELATLWSRSRGPTSSRTGPRRSASTSTTTRAARPSQT